MPKFAVIIPAAGKGSRFIGKEGAGSNGFVAKKPFVSLNGQPVWLHGVKQFAQISEVIQIILVVAPEDLEGVRKEFDSELSRYDVETVAGGSARFESVENGLASVRNDIDYVAIHDAARPCVTRQMIEDVFQAAIESDAAIPATPIVGTIKRSVPSDENGVWIETTKSRERLWEAQTPQVFRKDVYQNAVAKRGDFSPTDDAGLLERLGVGVRIVPGNRTNIKITTPFDLKLAEKFLEMNEYHSQ